MTLHRAAQHKEAKYSGSPEEGATGGAGAEGGKQGEERKWGKGRKKGGNSSVERGRKGKGATGAGVGLGPRGTWSTSPHTSCAMVTGFLGPLLWTGSCTSRDKVSFAHSPHFPSSPGHCPGC